MKKIIIGILLLSISHSCLFQKKEKNGTPPINTVITEDTGFDSSYENVLYPDPTNRFIYLNAQKDLADPNDFHVFTIDPSSKTTTLVQSMDLVSGIDQLLDTVFIHPNGQTLYVAISNIPNPGTLDVYTINQTNGTLTKIQTVTADQYASFNNIFYLSSGHLVAVNYSSSGYRYFNVFSIAGDGTLTLVNQSEAHSAYSTILKHPTNENLYFAADIYYDEIDVYQYDPATKTFSLNQEIQLSSDVLYPHILKITSNGKYLIMMQSWPGSKVYRYQINQTDGTLTEIDEYSYNVKGYNDYYDELGVEGTSGGQFAALLSSYDFKRDFLYINICTYKILGAVKVDKNSGEMEFWGGLDVALSTINCNYSPTAMKVDASNDYLYLYQRPLSNFDYVIQTYKILDTGGLELQQ